MGLFGGGNSKSDNSVHIDNSVQTTDYSTNTNNAGASIGNTDNSVDNSVVNITDGGAFEVAQSALDMGGKSVGQAMDFGGNALNVSQKTFESAIDLTKDVNQSSLDFGQSAMDSAVDAIKNSNDHSQQLISQTIDKSLATAAAATQSDSTNTMQSVTKIGIALAVVFGIGFISMGMKK